MGVEPCFSGGISRLLQFEDAAGRDGCASRWSCWNERGGACQSKPPVSSEKELDDVGEHLEQGTHQLEQPASARRAGQAVTSAIALLIPLGTSRSRQAELVWRDRSARMSEE